MMIRWPASTASNPGRGLLGRDWMGRDWNGRGSLIGPSSIATAAGPPFRACRVRGGWDLRLVSLGRSDHACANPP